MVGCTHLLFRTLVYLSFTPGDDSSSCCGHVIFGQCGFVSRGPNIEQQLIDGGTPASASAGTPPISTRSRTRTEGSKLKTQGQYIRPHYCCSTRTHATPYQVHTYIIYVERKKSKTTRYSEYNGPRTTQPPGLNRNAIADDKTYVPAVRVHPL